ncbi:MAG TPA: DUF455 family protein [Candidatus Kapabacteria bacterium]|nr:DUF455 family protein [Candidatus Kapabacteria bacterium]
MERNGHPVDRNSEMESEWTNSPALHGAGVPLARYNFPKDTRRLGGDFTVEENAKRLLRFFLFERNTLRAIAGWSMGTPEFEVKVEFGRHIYWHAEAGMKIRTRLTELRTAEEATDKFQSEDVAEFFSELMYSETPAHFVAALYGVLLPHIRQTYLEHSAHTDQVADAPTLRMIRHILVDYDEMIAWGTGAVEAYVQGGYSEPELHKWQYHIEKLLRSFGDVTGSPSYGKGGGWGVVSPTPRPETLRSAGKPPFERSFIATRDPRFGTFEHTENYQVADSGSIEYPTEFEQLRLNLVRTQRDEIDAIETFANVLYEIRNVPFGFDYDMARIIWDETRHTELGHKAMEALGYNPYDLLNRLLGIKVRTKLPALYSLAEINLFGEANIVQECLRYSREAFEKGDEVTGRMFDFVNADERTHLAKGIHWLKYLFGTDSVQEIEQKTKQVAVDRLLELGIIEPEVKLTISHRELAKIIGE